MKYTIITLIVFIICSCTNSQNTNNANQKTDVSNKNIEIMKQDEFQRDSSYVEFWCSSKILRQTEESIENLKLTTVAEFLATFDKSCKNNVEYSQHSNELLFAITNRKPDMLIKLLLSLIHI